MILSYGDIKWYKLSKKSKKLLQIMMLKCIEPDFITVWIIKNDFELHLSVSFIFY